MKDGTILLWVYGKHSTKLGPRLIAWWTGMPQYHALIYFEGQTYGMGGKGVVVSEGLAKADEYWEPIKPMTDEERERMRSFLWWTAKWEKGRWAYNFGKFAALIVVYPTRRFWNWLGWMPFQADLYGEHCATYPAYGWWAAGYTIVPDLWIDLIVPGDLAGLPDFRLSK